ncbi:hypothetical protein CHUAL_008583 [Chamberlinius hualienensis]
MTKLSMAAPKWLLSEFQTKKPSDYHKNKFHSRSVDLEKSNWINDEFDVDDDCRTYAEIESLSDFSNSEDDELTEIDSLESKESWRRFKKTKISVRQLQIQTINKMLGLATPTANGQPQNPDKTIDNLVKKDAEIASTLQQLLQVQAKISEDHIDDRLSNVNNNNCGPKVIVAKKGNEKEAEKEVNAKVIQHGEWFWGKSTFLP